MHPVRRRRLIMVLASVTAIAVAVALVAYSLRGSINLFYAPTQIVNGEAPLNKRIKIGGLVMDDSLIRANDSLRVDFVVTDKEHNINVAYEGILPDLFREGQGIVATGQLISKTAFQATEILAKHDETYMAPEVQDILKDVGHPVDASYSPNK